MKTQQDSAVTSWGTWSSAPQGAPLPTRRNAQHLAYFINQFPCLTETFIYREVAALRAFGNTMTTFSIRRPQPSEVSAEAQGFFDDTLYILPIGVFHLLSAHLKALVRYPVRYWQILLAVLNGTHTCFRDRLRTLCHFMEAVAVLPAVERRNISHLHAHYAVGSTTCAMVIARFLGIPFTFTAHAYDIWRDKLLLPEKLRAAQLIVTCTDSHRQHLAQTYGIAMEKFRVVYHGIDIRRFQPCQRPSNAEPVLVSVGRLVEQKGFDRLLQACALLVENGSRFQCDIIGDGPLRQDLERLVAKLKLTHRVRFRGRIFQEQLLDYYAAADLFVLPCIPASDADRDGIPNTLIEAMAMQLPVISTRFSGIPELVVDGSTGVLVEPDNVPALAEAMHTLLGNPVLRQRMGQAGRQRVVQHFAIENSAARLYEIFAALHANRTDKM